MKLKKLMPLLVGLLVMAGCGEKPTPNPTDQPTEQQTESTTVQPTDSNPTDSVVTPTEPPFEAVSLDVIKSTYKNNQEVQAEGVVYGVTTNGFFLADGENSYIFVNMGDNWANPVKIGDKVQVDAKFSLVSGYCMLKQAELEVIGQNETIPVVSVEKDLTFVKDLVASPSGDYGMLVKLVGTLSTNGASYLLTDDDGQVVTLAANSAAHLSSFVGKRITLEVVVYKTDSEGNWQLVFAGDENDIVDSTLTFADYVKLAKQELDTLVPATCTGNLSLPTVHKVDGSMTYTWAVKSGTSITILNNVATVIPPATDEEVTLTVTVTRGENSQEIDYTITSKAVVEQSVSSFMAQLPSSGDKVKVSGIVVAMGRNQGSTTEPYAATKRYVMIQDETTTDSVPVNYFYSSNDYGFEGLSVGDKITVTGSWLSEGGETDNPSINATSIELVSEGATYTDSKASAIVISSKEQYADLGENPDKYTGKLLKFDNPYLAYSTSGEPNPSNWLRFGADSRVDKVGGRSVATLLGLGNENVDDGWIKHFDIAYSGTEGKQFGGDIYAYLVYRSASYLQLCIPSVSYIELDNASQQAVYEQICNLQDEVESNSSLKLEEGFTYTFDNEIIDASGNVGTALENTEVAVTITKDDYSFTKKITVLSTATYNLTVGNEVNGSTTLSKSSDLLEGDEVEATFAPAEGYVTVSYTLTTDEGSVKYPAYQKTSATITVPGNATVTANYVLASDVATFNYSGGNSIAYYYVNGEYKNSSGSKTYTYDYVMSCIEDGQGNEIDPTIFGVEPITTFESGKWANFFDSNGRIALFSEKTGEYSGVKFTSKHKIHSITITYQSGTYVTRASVQSNGVELEKVIEGEAICSYMVDGNEFSITNISGGNYLYMKAINIVYEAPLYHEILSDADGHWSDCPVCDHEMAKEAHTYEDKKYEKDADGHAKICDTCEYVAEKEAHSFVDGICECGEIQQTGSENRTSVVIDANNANPTSKLLYGNANGEWLLSSNVIDEATFAQYVKYTDGTSYDTALFDFTPIANSDTGKVLNFSYKSNSYENRVMQIQPTAGITIDCQQKIAYIVVTYATNNSVDNSTRGLIKVNGEEVIGIQQGEGSVYQYAVNANSVTVMSNETALDGSSLFLYSIEIVYENAE